MPNVLVRDLDEGVLKQRRRPPGHTDGLSKRRSTPSWKVPAFGALPKPGASPINGCGG